MTAAINPGDPALGGSDAALHDLRKLLSLDGGRELEELRADIGRLDGRVGSPDRFRRSVAETLAGALKVAEVENHRELASAMAPLVISGIRREVEQSRDAVVEALYPVTGRMVAAAVAAMFRQLSDDVNRRLEDVISPRMHRLRFKALVTRRPLAELILAESAAGRVERVIVIERATGAVLAATRADGLPDAERSGTLNLVGGLVTAILSFAGEALSEIRGELRQLDFGGQTVLLRASPLYIVAAVVGAGVPASRLPPVEADILDFLDEVGSKLGDLTASVGRLHERLALRLAPERPVRRISPLAVMAALLLAGLLWASFAWWRGAAEAGHEDATLASIERLPALAGYPVRLAFDRGQHTIRASGLVQDRDGLGSLRSELARALPAWPVDERVAVLSETPPVQAAEARARASEARVQAAETGVQAIEGEVARLREAAADDRGRRALEALARRTDGLTGELAAVSRQGEQDRRALTAEMTALQTASVQDGERRATEVAAIRREVTALGDRLDPPWRQLDDTVRGTAVFFQSGSAVYLAPDAAEGALRRLAQALLANDGARLRVVGYGDGSGGAAANTEAARKRAERVAADLRGLGVDGSRLTLVTKRPPLSNTDAAPASANRRAVFELAYPGEP